MKSFQYSSSSPASENFAGKRPAIVTQSHSEDHDGTPTRDYIGEPVISGGLKSSFRYSRPVFEPSVTKEDKGSYALVKSFRQLIPGFTFSSHAKSTLASQLSESPVYPDGFRPRTLEERKKLGWYPDYAELSGVPWPKPYLDFDPEKALPRPYRPFRWPYHQTMGKPPFLLQFGENY